MKELMRESVSAVFVAMGKIYFTKRNNHLNVFPGYHATPGGKVEETDSNELDKIFEDVAVLNSTVRPQILNALIREVREELNFDLLEAIKEGSVLKINDLGVAITPEFNPYRFKNYYYKIELKSPIEFDLDKEEAEFGIWQTSREFLNQFEMGKILAVPPAIRILRSLENEKFTDEILNLTHEYDADQFVPMIESLAGIRQLLPLSNTFPPANRTNSFIIGDENEKKFLIDPSPKDEVELKKFENSINKIGFFAIMLTHHHPDHYEFSNVIAKKYNVPMYMSADTYKRIGEKYFEGIDVHLLKEGDCLTKSLGRDIFVYEVPGHDEGQLALAPKTMEWFLVGDLIQTNGTVAILAPEGNMKKYFATLKRVIELNPKYIIPSHGIIIGGVNKLIETLNHRTAREGQIIELLNANKTLDEMIAIIYPTLKESLIPYAKKTIEAHIEKIRS
jgi:ribonuclease/clavin/mitogillin